MRKIVPWVLALALACKKEAAPPAPPAERRPETPAPKLTRAELNRNAARLNLPLYWAADRNGNGAPDPDEVRGLLFYPTVGRWAEQGRFTAAFREAFSRIARFGAAQDGSLPAVERERRRLVLQDLDQGAATLVESDLSSLGAEEKAFVRKMLEAAHLIDALHARMTGVAAVRGLVLADDAASQSLLRRNWTSRCRAPKTEKNPACSAIPGAPPHLVDVYPQAFQKDPGFCESLEKRPDAKELLTPFTVVREEGGKLAAVPYHRAYTQEMAAVSAKLREALRALGDPGEAPLRAYLEAAAQAFLDNRWEAADEAWSRMSARSSRWYVRVGPDETYWEPCAHKAGFHLTFARVDPDSLAWQDRLAPVQQAMERAVAALIGAPYRERKVTFHLPDFIRIVFNAGDDRSPFGGTIGQSLPNWGKVVDEGRGRTMAVTNLYGDPDSLRMRRAGAESLIVREGLAAYREDAKADLLNTILHEAAHNLGPSHDYRYGGKTAAEAFGGSLAAMLEELKAEVTGLWLVDFLRAQGILTQAQARETYLYVVVWSFGHVSRGMYDAKGRRKAYSQVAAILLGSLQDEGAIAYEPTAAAANGADRGAYSVHLERFPAALEKIARRVGAIKAKADKAAALELAKRYVDGPTVPQKVITERILRNPRQTFVYALGL
jgi:hypothetical protein